ncbi:MAG: indolepyruvate ferredoxin oxidoreductase subunit alpha [Candidatus Hodarchaeota archaeon]
MATSLEQKSYEIRVNYYICTGCGDCMTACPVNLDIRHKEGKLDETNAVILVKNANCRVINEDACNGCGSCIPACPVKAIDIIMKEE